MEQFIKIAEILSVIFAFASCVILLYVLIYDITHKERNLTIIKLWIAGFILGMGWIALGFLCIEEDCSLSSMIWRVLLFILDGFCAFLMALNLEEASEEQANKKMQIVIKGGDEKIIQDIKEFLVNHPQVNETTVFQLIVEKKESNEEAQKVEGTATKTPNSIEASLSAVFLT